MPTTLAASVAENVAENHARPSRSALTVGMIVVTASASKATRKIRLTMPTVAHRYAGASSGVVVDGVGRGHLARVGVPLRFTSSQRRLPRCQPWTPGQCC